MNCSAHDYSRFTEQEYVVLLGAAKRRWRFVCFEDFATVEPAVLWRHDIDFSAHRALALAAIEASLGIASTYFILLHGEFYNPLEASITGIFKQIAGMGHRLGLHFDPAYYGDAISEQRILAEKLAAEKKMLESIFEVPITVFSWHNPTVSNVLSIDDSYMAGMINAYCREIRSKYTYISDSNGIWRHRTLHELLEFPVAHLQVLTHPEWWVPEPLAPRDRILRAVNGRAAACMRNYDRLLAEHERPNIHGANNGTPTENAG